jgi:hypothetical protein
MSDEPKYQCTECSSTFVAKRSLDYHRKICNVAPLEPPRNACHCAAGHCQFHEGDE